MPHAGVQPVPLLFDKGVTRSKKKIGLLCAPYIIVIMTTDEGWLAMSDVLEMSDAIEMSGEGRWPAGRIAVRGLTGPGILAGSSLHFSPRVRKLVVVRQEIGSHIQRSIHIEVVMQRSGDSMYEGHIVETRVSWMEEVDYGMC